MDSTTLFETYLKVGWNDFSKSKDWLRFRKHWLSDNPPIDGFYLCGICGRWVDASEVTLDHIRPRRADNIFDPNNIQPAHGYCNNKKGSRHWKPKVSREVYDYLYRLRDM